MPENDELLTEFQPHEIATARSILSCMEGPVTADKFRRMLLLFLRGHYASPLNYLEFEHLKCYTWHSESSQRTLEIEFSHREDDRKPDAFPGIYVTFGRVDLEKLAIGDIGGMSQDRASTYLVKGAKAIFNIVHVSKNASDAYDLADLTTRVLVAMAAPLAHNAGATNFEVKGYQPPADKKQAPEAYYSVAIQVELGYNMTVTRRLESHRLRQIISIVTNSQ